MKPNFENIVKQFAFEGKFIEANPYGSGHINDTYAASFQKADGATHRYILQRSMTVYLKNQQSLWKT